MTPSGPSPAELGYRFPAEWEPHAATWLAWPHNEDTWPGKRHAAVPEFVRFVLTVAEVEPVHLLAGGDAVRREAERHVGRHPNVVLHDIPTNDAWTRDHGPTFLVAREDHHSLQPALVDWRFNSWGEKYPPFDLDDAVPRRIAEVTGRKRFAAEMVLEGGAIDGNGQGTLMTTRRCVLDARRNPGLDKQAAERAFADFLGARRVIWLDGELAGDDTDGHIDQMARFVGPARVAAVLQDDPSDANYDVTQANWKRLAEARTAGGEPLELVALPMPTPLYYEERRLPASYANFYIANQLVVVPQFGDARNDQRACAILRDVFSDREIVGLSAIELVWGLGAFHCLSQQEPWERS